MIAFNRLGKRTSEFSFVRESVLNSRARSQLVSNPPILPLYKMFHCRKSQRSVCVLAYLRPSHRGSFKILTLLNIVLVIIFKFSLVSSLRNEPQQFLSVRSLKFTQFYRRPRDLLQLLYLFIHCPGARPRL